MGENHVHTVLTHMTERDTEPRPLSVGLTNNEDLIFLTAPDAGRYSMGEIVVWLDAKMARDAADALVKLAALLDGS